MDKEFEAAAQVRAEIDAAARAEAQAMQEARRLAAARAARQQVDLAVANCLEARARRSELMRQLIGLVESERPV